jgi:hypothetical protein
MFSCTYCSYVHNFRSYDHIYAYLSSLNVNGKFTQHKIDLTNRFDASLISFPKSIFAHKSFTTLLELIHVS